MSHRLLFALALVPAFLATSVPLARACAVPTSFRVENQRTVPVVALHVSEPPAGAGPSVLPAAGLAPGEAVTVTLPSCIGIYEVRAVFADGRTTVHPNLNATTLRGLSLR